MQSECLLKFCMIQLYLKLNYVIKRTCTLEIFCSVILFRKDYCYGSLIIDGCCFYDHQKWNFNQISHRYISLVIISEGHTQLLFYFFGRDCMVVESTATYAISGYHHWCCEFEWLIARCNRYIIMWWSWSVICGRSVVFSGYSRFLHQ
jgi:hypothetical protein